MKKRIIGLLVSVLVSCFAVNVNAEIKDCSNENYSKVKDLSFEDYKEVTSHTISDSIAKIEDGKLTISIATRNDPEMNVNSKYTYDDVTFKSIGGYYSIQGQGIFEVYALSNEGKVYRVVADYMEADKNPSYKPELKETGLTNIEHIATPDDSEEFYLIEKPEYVPHQAVYAIDSKGDVYTDETMLDGGFCKITNPNPKVEEPAEAGESTEKTVGSLTESTKVPVCMVAVLTGIFGIVIGFLIGRKGKKKTGNE